MKNKRSNNEVLAEQFINMWQSAENIGSVANALHITRRQATVRAEYYRRQGVALKKFPKGRVPKFDWVRLSKIAENNEPK